MKTANEAPFFGKIAFPGFLFAALLCAAGCGAGRTGAGATEGTSGLRTFQGRVMGGQQPISGAQIKLYAAAKTAGGTSRDMLTSSVTTLSDGSFSLTGKYSCQTGDQVYLVATGGDAGGGGNSAIAMMAALGPCSTLLANANTTFIQLNEVTTVASAFALASYITDAQTVSSAGDTASTNALAAAFATTKTMVDTSTGIAPATSVGNGVVPETTLYSLANSLAGCINSASSTSSACNSLFTATTVGGTRPATTLDAVINVAHNPALNSAQVYAVAGPNPPFQPTLSAAPATYALTVLHPSDVLTYHNDVGRRGVQTAEVTLTKGNVNSAAFGKKYTFTVDGELYAQPLYVGGWGMPDGNVHNLVIAATATGTVYAFDADGNNPAQGYLWRQSVFATGETTVTVSDYGCGDTTPNSSLLGTPVIDRATGTVYVVSTAKVTASSTFNQKIHALSLVDGSEKFNGPTVITASVTGTGAGAQSGQVSFNALTENQRPALLLSGGSVWITWASHCDIGPYHGWIMAYSAADVSTRTVLFNNTPNGSDGGIWMAGGGPAADAQGYIYTVSGNGTFDADTGGPDYGDSGVKMAAPTGSSTTPTVVDYFTPYNQQQLSSADADVGVTNALLFSDAASSFAPGLMLESDKTGKIYLLNTSNMGTFSTSNRDLQDFSIGGGIYNNFAYFNGTLYADYNGGPVRAFAFVPGTSTAGGHFNTSYTSQATSNTVGGGGGFGGAAPVVSANGVANGIVWTQDHAGSNPVLRAFDASDLAVELYNSGQAAGNRDKLPTQVKFTSPVIANGQVFVGGNGTLTVFGLLP